MIKSFLKSIFALTVFTTSIMIFNPIEASAEWRSDYKGWWYTQGDSYATGWKEIDGKWYYFYSDGYMAHDINIDKYYLSSSGAWVANTNSNITSTGEEGELLNKLKANCSSEILNYYYDDFDKDGKKELLAITGVRSTWAESGTSNGTLWLVNNDSVKIVDSQKVDYVTAEVIDLGNAKHLVLHGNAGGPGNWFSIYEVKGNNGNILYKNKGGSITKGSDGKLYFYTSALDAATISPNSDDLYSGRTFKTYYVYYDGQYKEFGGINISKEDLFNFENGEDIWNSLVQEIKSTNPVNVTSNILYRENGIININFKVTNSDGIKSNYNAIVKYKDNKLSIEKPDEYNRYKDSDMIGSGKVNSYGTPFVVSYPDSIE